MKNFKKTLAVILSVLFVVPMLAVGVVADMNYKMFFDANGGTFGGALRATFPTGLNVLYEDVPGWARYQRDSENNVLPHEADAVADDGSEFLAWDAELSASGYYPGDETRYFYNVYNGGWFATSYDVYFTALWKNDATPTHVHDYEVTFSNPDGVLGADFGLFAKASEVTYPANEDDTVADLFGGTELEATPAEGYDFIGWYDDNNLFYSYLDDIIVDRDIVLTPAFVQKQYSITFNANGGKFDGMDTYTFRMNSTDTVASITGWTAFPTPTRTGYNFTGWELTVGGAGTGKYIGDNDVFPTGVNETYSFSAAYGDDVTFVAEWLNPTGKDYVLAFDPQGGTIGGSSDPLVYGANKGDLLVNLDGWNGVPVPERDGYIFKGWVRDTNASLTYDNWQAMANGKFNQSSDMVFLALWTPIVTRTYKFVTGNPADTGRYFLGTTAQELTYTFSNNVSMYEALPNGLLPVVLRDGNWCSVWTVAEFVEDINAYYNTPLQYIADSEDRVNVEINSVTASERDWVVAGGGGYAQPGYTTTDPLPQEYVDMGTKHDTFVSATLYGYYQHPISVHYYDTDGTQLTVGSLSGWNVNNPQLEKYEGTDRYVSAWSFTPDGEAIMGKDDASYTLSAQEIADRIDYLDLKQPADNTVNPNAVTPYYTDIGVKLYVKWIPAVSIVSTGLDLTFNTGFGLATTAYSTGDAFVRDLVSGSSAVAHTVNYYADNTFEYTATSANITNRNHFDYYLINSNGELIDSPVRYAKHGEFTFTYNGTTYTAAETTSANNAVALNTPGTYQVLAVYNQSNQFQGACAVVPGTITVAAPVPDIAISKKAISLNNGVNIKYYVDASQFGADGYDFSTAAFTVGNTTLTGTLENGYYVYTYSNVNPAQFGLAVNAKLTATTTSGAKTSTAQLSYSVAQYCANMLAKASTPAKVKALCAAIINYAVESENYYKANGGFLMTSALTVVQNKTGAYDAYTAALASVPDKGYTAAPSNASGVGFTVDAATLVLGSSIALRFYLTIPTGLSATELSVTATVHSLIAAEETYTLDIQQDGDGNYYVDFDKVGPNMGDVVVSLSVYHSGFQMTSKFDYSIATYCINKHGDATVGALADSILTYCYATADFLGL